MLNLYLIAVSKRKIISISNEKVNSRININSNIIRNSSYIKNNSNIININFFISSGIISSNRAVKPKTLIVNWLSAPIVTTLICTSTRMAVS